MSYTQYERLSVNLRKITQSQLNWRVKTLNRGDHAYNFIRQHLGSDAISFARMRIGADYYLWTSDELNLIPFDKLDAAQRQMANALLADLKSRTASALSSFDHSVVDALCCYPDESFLYLAQDGSHVVIAGWGFSNYKKQPPQTLIDDLSRDKAHRVRIGFINKGQLVPHRNFVTKHSLSTNNRETGDDGFFLVGEKIKPGTKIAVTDVLTGKNAVIVVNDTQEDYTIDVTVEERPVQRKTYYDIKVVNQDELPSPHYELKINDRLYTTDSRGIVEFHDVVVDEANNTVHVSDIDGNSETYHLLPDIAQHHFVFKHEEKFISSLRIKVQYEDGEPVEGCPLDIIVGDTTLKRTTNADGLVDLEQMEPDSLVHIESMGEISGSADVTLKRGSNEVVITLKPLAPKMVRIGIADYEKHPIPYLAVKVKTPLGEYDMTTDDQGNVWLPATNFVHRKKVQISFTYNGGEKKLKL